MSHPEKTTPRQEPVQHQPEDAEPLEDDELSIEELEEAAGGTGEIQSPETQTGCS